MVSSLLGSLGLHLRPDCRNLLLARWKLHRLCVQGENPAVVERFQWLVRRENREAPGVCVMRGVLAGWEGLVVWRREWDCHDSPAS